MEGIERTNVVVVYSNQKTGLVLYNPYVIKVDMRRNYYSCRGFGYLAQNYRR